MYELVADRVRREALLLRSMIVQIVQVGEDLLQEPLRFPHLMVVFEDGPTERKLGAFLELNRFAEHSFQNVIWGYTLGEDPQFLSTVRLTSLTHDDYQAVPGERQRIETLSDQAVLELHERLLPLMIRALCPENPVEGLLPGGDLSRDEKIGLLQRAGLEHPETGEYLRELSLMLDERFASLDELGRLRDCVIPLALVYAVQTLRLHPKWKGAG